MGILFYWRSFLKSSFSLCKKRLFKTKCRIRSLFRILGGFLLSSFPVYLEAADVGIYERPYDRVFSCYKEPDYNGAGALIYTLRRYHEKSKRYEFIATLDTGEVVTVSEKPQIAVRFRGETKNPVVMIRDVRDSIHYVSVYVKDETVLLDVYLENEAVDTNVFQEGYRCRILRP
jgi:hypothetical protein